MGFKNKTEGKKEGRKQKGQKLQNKISELEIQKDTTKKKRKAKKIE